MTLTDFLLARIAEDEAQANLSTEQLASNPNLRIPASWVEGVAARVLAECEAKRRIVEALIDAQTAVATYNTDDPNNPPSYWQEWGNCHALRFAVESHAATYADHPDYREEWRP